MNEYIVTELVPHFSRYKLVKYHVVGLLKPHFLIFLYSRILVGHDTLFD